MAYVLGFFMADGALTKNPRGSKYVDIGITDKDLLEKIRNCFGSNHKITIRKSSKPNQKDIFRLQIGSKTMFNSLLKFGLSPNKTFRFKLPNIPTKYFANFVRGYFDGDGSVWFGLSHKSRKTQTPTLQASFISGNKKFIENLAKSLSEHLKIKGTLSYYSNAYRLIYSTTASLSLYNFMYTNDNNLYLERKKKIFEKYLRMI